MAEKPDWLTQMDAARAPAPAAAPVEKPDWLVQMDAGKEAPARDPDAGLDHRMARAFLSDVAKIPSWIAGAPRGLVDLKVALQGRAGPIDQTLQSVLPSADGINSAVSAAYEGATGRKAPQFVEHETPLGRMVGAGITGAGAVLADPFSAFSAAGKAPNIVEGLTAFLRSLPAKAPTTGKVAASTAAAEGAHEAFPNSQVIPLAAAVATHGSMGTAGKIARGINETMLPVMKPGKAAEVAAGRALSGVPNDPDYTPGIARPSAADIRAGEEDVRAHSQRFDSPLDNYQAGGTIRENLQTRADALTQRRREIGQEAYGRFEEQQPLEAARLTRPLADGTLPFMDRPAFRRAVRDAADATLNEGHAPLTEFLDFNSAGDPVFRPNAALPPQVLDRMKGRLDDAVSTAQPGTRGQTTARTLRDAFVRFLDNEYSETYPRTRADYADASRPLDPYTQGPVSKALDSENVYGRRRYSMPQDRIPDMFLKSPAMRSDFDNLVAGYGGDQNAARTALRANLVDKVQDAINPDGTLSVAAFDKSVKPYTRALDMWFPDLNREFNSAKSAQAVLDNMRSQETMAASIEQGALRGTDGFITRASADKWLKGNEQALASTQTPGAVMRLRTIIQALPERPFSAAEKTGGIALSGMGVVGSGRVEGGVLGALKGLTPLEGRIDSARQAFSAAIERAITDPAYAQRLATSVATRPRGVTNTQALLQALGSELAQGAKYAPVTTTPARTGQ
jgi:hypothetical protein